MIFLRLVGSSQSLKMSFFAAFSCHSFDWMRRSISVWIASLPLSVPFGMGSNVVKVVLELS